MIAATLKRVHSREDGMFGVFAIANLPIAVTVEKPWRDNKRGISCIPAGTYQAKRIISPSHGDCFEITNVPNRSHILIHAGNIDDDVEGCVAIGEYFHTWKDGTCSIASSKIAYAELMQRLAGVKEFTLAVIDCTANS